MFPGTKREKKVDHIVEFQLHEISSNSLMSKFDEMVQPFKTKKDQVLDIWCKKNYS